MNPNAITETDLDFGATARDLSSGLVLFDRFATKRILGRGGMGVVWLAEDRKLKRDVALKFLPQIVVGDAAGLGDLRKETRNGLLLSHPNLVRMLDLVEEGPAAAIVMEFVDGHNLSALRLQQHNLVFEASTLRPYLDQILNALEYAHSEAKLVHRDLKPANVMVNSQDQIKIADFGIASCVRDSVSRVSLQVNSAAGTLVYVSPQQMMGEVAKPSDDLYSLGAMLFELLTGKPPFYAGDISKQVETRIPPKVSERRREFGIEGEPVPEEWEVVIAACLEKDHRDRPENVAAIREGLAGRKMKRGSGDTTTRTRPLPTTAAGQRRTAAPALPSWAIPAGLGALALLSAVAWYFGSHVPGEKRKATALAQQTQERRAEAERRTTADAKLREFQDELATVETSEMRLDSARKKRALWNQAAISLQEYDYPYGDQEVEMRNRVAQRLAELADAEVAEERAYQALLADKTTALGTLRTEAARPDLGARPKHKAWQSFVDGWDAAAFNADYGSAHEPLIAEARQEAAKWQEAIAAETPATALTATTVFQGGVIASWNDDGKKAGIYVVQNALKTAGLYAGATDGTYNAALHEAILKFQEQKDLPMTGRLDQITLDAMEIPTNEPPK